MLGDRLCPCGGQCRRDRCEGWSIVSKSCFVWLILAELHQLVEALPKPLTEMPAPHVMDVESSLGRWQPTVAKPIRRKKEPEH